MRRTFFSMALLAIGSWLLLSGLTLAQTQHEREPLSTEEFVKKVSADGLAEVDLAKLAMKQSTSEAIHRFAQRMIQDHTKANKQLSSIANKQSIPIATAMDKKHRQLADKLSSLQGPAFDREYMMHMVQDHRQAVSLFEHEAKTGKDPAVKQFAAQTLPILREHLKLALQISGQGNPIHSGPSK